MNFSHWVHCMPRVLFAGLLWACTGLPATFGVPGFLYLEGIPGEAKAEQHAGWIEVESFQHGLSRQSLEAHSGSRRQPAVFQSFHIRKQVDKASPSLIQAVTEATAIPTAKLDLVVPDGKQVRFYQIALKDVSIVALNSHSGAGNDRPLEEVALNYDKISWTYTEAESPKGPSSDEPVLSKLHKGLRSGKLQALQTGFQVSAEKLDGFNLRWQAVPGKKYRILTSSSITGPYILVDTVTAEAEDAQVEVPAQGPNQFFLIKVEEP